MGLKKDMHITLKILTNIYFKITEFNRIWQTVKIKYFSLYKHKKLNYFQIIFKNKFYNFSAGQLLNKHLNRTRSFKKSINSFGTTINTLNRKLHKQFNSIYIFYIKNFNFQLYLWTKKFFYLIKPYIYFTIITNSWNYINKKKKRIKKKFLEIYSN